MRQPHEKNKRIYPRLPVAGAGVLVLKNGRLLLVKRGKNPRKGKWSIPGGGIELGETVYEAARRETLEECYIDVEIERVLDTADIIDLDEKGRARYHFIVIDLLAKYISGELKAGDDAAECGWFTPEEVRNMDITPTLRAMLEKHGIIGGGKGKKF